MDAKQRKKRTEEINRRIENYEIDIEAYEHDIEVARYCIAELVAERDSLWRKVPAELQKWYNEQAARR